MIPTIEFNRTRYPQFQSLGNASQFAIPFARHVCKGEGYDIGCNKKEWSFPESIPIDITFNDGYSALKLPFEHYGQVDYVYSSHCLEHIEGSWYSTLNYWVTNIRKRGTLFLYLPDYSQEYWRPWNNKKHIHCFTPEMIYDAFHALNLKNIFVSGIDLNNSFMAMGEV